MLNKIKQKRREEAKEKFKEMGVSFKGSKLGYRDLHYADKDTKEDILKLIDESIDKSAKEVLEKIKPILTNIYCYASDHADDIQELVNKITDALQSQTIDKSAEEVLEGVFENKLEINKIILQALKEVERTKVVKIPYKSSIIKRVTGQFISYKTNKLKK